MISKHDIVVWHSFTGDKEVRVIWVYNEEPKTLLVTTNLDDEQGHGPCYHAPTIDCEFLRKGPEFQRVIATKQAHHEAPIAHTTQRGEG
jgi:hypothetical protein